MTDRMNPREAALLKAIQDEQAALSEKQHTMARQQSILTRAATQLRLGRSAAVVVAEIEEQDASLLPSVNGDQPARV